ncbi:MAG: type 4a pilus biogenesis protein PilO [Desulfomonile sp.]|nr:type 4a pilus biogenesis protein PilO [Desulfomonile sp.]
MTPQELFFKLAGWQRFAAVGGICALLIAAFYFFFVSDMFVEISRIEKEIEQFNIQILNQQKILAQGPELEKKIEGLRAQLQTMVASLPEKQEIEGLLKKITDLLSESRLTASRFVPGQEQINTELQYATIPITLTVKGDYQKQGAFLARLQDLPRIVNVPKISLAKGDLGGREGAVAKNLEIVPLNAEISGVTFRRLSPEEVKSLAKPPPAKAPPPRRAGGFRK